MEALNFSASFSLSISLCLSRPVSNQVSYRVSPARMCSRKSYSHTTCNLTMQEEQHGTWRNEEGKKGIERRESTKRRSPSLRTTRRRHVTFGRERQRERGMRKKISKQRKACWRHHILLRLCHLFSLPDKHVLSQRCASRQGETQQIHSESAPSLSV